LVFWARRVNPDQYCREKVAPPGSSLHYAFLFLPPDRRRALTALYAFCSEVEDVVDECSDTQLGGTKLAWWRSEIAALYAGNPRHPVSLALQPFVAGFEISAGQLEGIVAGMEQDLMQTRYLDFAGLARHCEAVAGGVARLAARICGYRNARTLEYATSIATAIQLTGVICDVGVDARRNRIYLPMDELKRFEVPAADILQARYSNGFVELMKFQSARADDFYRKAIATLPMEDRRAQRASLTMAAISRTTLAEIERDGFQVLAQRTSLTPLRKLWLAWKTWLST